MVPPHADGHAAAGPSHAEDYARRQRERAEARSRTRRMTRELAVAIDAAEAGYSGLRRRLNDYGSGLEAVRARLSQGPRPVLGAS